MSKARFDDNAGVQDLVSFHCQASDKCQTAKQAWNRNDLRNSGGFRKAALTQETKSYFLTEPGYKSQLTFPPLQQDCLEKCMSCSAGCMDMSIPWESHTEGCLVRKRNSTDPDFGIS